MEMIADIVSCRQKRPRTALEPAETYWERVQREQDGLKHAKNGLRTT